MSCPYCQGDATQVLERTTAWGYRLFRCRPCRRTFNERTGTPVNHLQVPTDSALLVVLWRLRYKLSLRDLAEMFLTRGFTFTHETVREWEERFAPLLTERLRAKRRGKAGLKWHADETYVKVDGRGLGHMTLDILGKATFRIRVSPPIKRFDLLRRIVRASSPHRLAL